jgi:hypothetical protein
MLKARGTRSIRLEARKLGSWDAKGKHKGDRINLPESGGQARQKYGG